MWTFSRFHGRRHVIRNSRRRPNLLTQIRGRNRPTLKHWRRVSSPLRPRAVPFDSAAELGRCSSCSPNSETDPSGRSFSRPVAIHFTFFFRSARNTVGVFHQSLMTNTIQSSSLGSHSWDSRSVEPKFKRAATKSSIYSVGLPLGATTWSTERGKRTIPSLNLLAVQPSCKASQEPSKASKKKASIRCIANVYFVSSRT